jgi:hypothetical protein
MNHMVIVIHPSIHGHQGHIDYFKKTLVRLTMDDIGFIFWLICHGTQLRQKYFKVIG